MEAVHFPEKIPQKWTVQPLMPGHRQNMVAQAWQMKWFRLPMRSA
jgi:hypothetical protein